LFVHFLLTVIFVSLQGTYGDIYNFPEAAYSSALASAEGEIADGESEEAEIEVASSSKRQKIGARDEGSSEEEGEEEDGQAFPSLAQFVAADESDDDGGNPQRCVYLPSVPCSLVSPPLTILPFSLTTVCSWATMKCVSQRASLQSTLPCRRALALATLRKSEQRLQLSSHLALAAPRL
jgi:hypothetical protein